MHILINYRKKIQSLLSVILIVGILSSHTFVAQAASVANTFSLQDAHQLQTEQHLSNTVTAFLVGPGFWDPLSKSVYPAGNLAPNSVVTYTNTFGNGGGTTVTGAFMIDNLDANLINPQTLPGVNVITAGTPATTVTATPTYQHVVAGAFDTNPAAPVIAIRWDFSPIPPGFSGTVKFTANISPTATEGTAIPNNITISGGGIPASTSNTVVTPVSSNLLLRKTADKSTATVGDVINYSLAISNPNKALTLPTVTATDYLPQGLRYVKGSAMITTASGTTALANPTISTDGQVLVFSGIGSLSAGAAVTITYSTIVGAPAALLDTLTNTAKANAVIAGGYTISSNTADAKTKMDLGLLGTQNIIVGKVFIDDNDNKIQDNGELGVPKVKLYLEDGTYTYTDFEGKYHFEGVKPGLHTVRVDTRSMNPDMELLIVSNQNGGNPESTFVDIKTGGGLYKANFRVKGNQFAANVSFKMNYYLTTKKESIVTREYHLSERVFFDPGKENLRPDAIKMLNEYLDILKQYKDRIVSIDMQVEGHTDNQPMGQTNKKKFGADEGLGYARAEMVKEYLKKNFGFSDDTFSAMDGYGDYLPAANNATLSGKQTNRRTDIHAFFVVQDVVKTYQVQSTDNNIVNLSAKTDYALPLHDVYIVAVGDKTGNIYPASASINGKAPLYSQYYPDSSVFLWKVGTLNADSMTLDMSVILQHGLSAKEFGQSTRLYIAGKPTNRDTFYVLGSIDPQDEQQVAIDRNNITKLLAVEDPKVNEEIAQSTIKPEQLTPLDRVYADLDNKEYLDNANSNLEILYPSGDTMQANNSTRIIVKYPAKFNLSVSVNDKQAPDNSIGRKINNPKKGYNIYEFVGIPLDTGMNNIKVQLGDNFGNIRGSASGTILVAGAADHIIVNAVRELLADGKTEPEITFSVFDVNNNPATDGMVTVTITDGYKIVTPDANPGSQGHQISYQNGKGIIKLASTNKTGQFNLNFYIDSVKETRTEKFAFVPVAQDWFITGQTQLSTQGATTLTPKANNAQAQVFAKGTPFADYLLTMRVDTNKTIDKQKLFGQITPGKLYPTYGDSSVQGYEANSQGPIFARLERSNMYLQYGDYATGFNDTTLTAYNRSFSGVQGYYKLDNLRSYAYQSTTSQSQVRNIISANGTSGPYSLQFNSVVENSERVTIESRDRFRPEVIVSSVTLTRYDDYTIDYATGRILFNHPIYITDNNFNPQNIVVLYETNGGNASFNNIGGRLAYDLDQSGSSNIGVTAVSEDKAAGTSTMYGADTAITLGNTKLKAEYGTTNLVDIVGKASAASAYKMSLTTRLGTNLTAGIEHQNIGIGYSNLSMSSPDVGTVKTGGNITYNLGDLKLGAQGYTSDFLSTNLNRSVAGLFAQKSFGIFNVGLGYDSVTENDKNAGTSLNSQLGKANVSAIVGNLSGRISREQVLNNTMINAYPNRTVLGLDYRLQEFITANVTHEIADTASGSQSLTHLGLSSKFKLSETMTSYADYGIDNSISGQQAVAKVGLRNQVQLTDKLSGNISLDRGQVLSGTSTNPIGMNNSVGDYTSYAISGQYLEDTYKVSARVEQKIAQGSNANLYSLGYTTLVNQDMSVLLSEVYSDGTSGANNFSSNNFSLGLAYRPVGWDSFNSLLKISSVNSTDTTGASSDKLFAIADFNYQPVSKLTLQGRYGIVNGTNKLANGLLITTTTTLIGGRFNYEIADRLDAGLHFSTLSQVQTSTALKSFGVHAGYNLMKDFWVELGYNVDGYDDTAFNNTNTQQGAYVDMRFKFDENTLGLRNKSKVFVANTAPLNLSYSNSLNRMFVANTDTVNLNYGSHKVFVADASNVKLNYGNSRPVVFTANPVAMSIQYAPGLSGQIGYEIRKDAYNMFLTKQAMMFKASDKTVNISYN